MVLRRNRATTHISADTHRRYGGRCWFCYAFGADTCGDWRCFLATCAATGALGWFIFLTFSLLPLYDITPVRHLLDRTELTAYAVTYLVFKKASAFVCVVVLVDLPPCLFVYPEGRRADIDNRDI